MLRLILIAVPLVAGIVLGLPAQASDIGKLFVQEFCIECHGPETQEADLRVDQLATMSNDDSTEIWHQAWYQVRSEEMPPQDVDQPTDERRLQFLDWIVSKYGRPSDPTDTDHWSLHPPKRTSVSVTESEQYTNPVDWFVGKRLRKNGLSFSEMADRRSLLRRVTLDLTGLPPTRDEIREFVAASGPTEVAYGRVVDRLLASPHYGERWAQHWLDVIRWAETVGFETNRERANAWHYRDWVIHAFNDDLPYDQFVTEQLLGDQSGNDAALGFLVAGPANLPGQIGRDEEAMRQARQDELDEVIRTVSQGLFGLTVGCARCHDHKFDPISQKDYYSLQAVFAGLQYGDRRLRGKLNDEWASKVPHSRSVLQGLKDELAEAQQRHSLRPSLADVQSESFQPVVADAVRMEIQATTNGPPSLYEFQIWRDTKLEPDASVDNVALASSGAVPSASSFALANQTRHFENLVDGSTDRRQSFPWVAKQSAPAWVQVDLANPTAIDRVTWHSGASVPASYVIKVRHASDGNWIDVAETGDRLPRIDDMRPANAVQLNSVTAVETAKLMNLIKQIRKQQQELSRLSSGPKTYAALFVDSPPQTQLLRRGDPMQPVAEVFASAPTALVGSTPTKNPIDEPERRRLLVDHLTRPDHPLTARVMVNRIWQHHFGTGLVETSSDFGRMGRPPSHPELLDHMAIEFIENGWSVKRLHRSMVMSRTYTQSSRPREEALRIDADSRLLWRFPPRRLDAESIRDSILSVSGKLNRSMRGRGFDFFNQRGGLSDYRPKESFDSEGWRRMVYAHKIRMQAIDVFGAFDCPDSGQMTPKRNQSITPIQSLGLLNSPFANRQSGFLADRIRAQTGNDLQASIKALFAIALSRAPTAIEQSALAHLAAEHGLEQACRVILNASEFVSLQ